MEECLLENSGAGREYDVVVVFWPEFVRRASLGEPRLSNPPSPSAPDPSCTLQDQSTFISESAQETAMPSYISLLRFTQQGMANIK